MVTVAARQNEWVGLERRACITHCPQSEDFSGTAWPQLPRFGGYGHLYNTGVKARKRRGEEEDASRSTFSFDWQNVGKEVVGVGLATLTDGPYH